jgi:signal peptidase II
MKKKQPSALKGSSLWGIVVFCVLILIDQLTKAVAEMYMQPYGTPIPLIGDLVTLQLVYNPGIAWGIGANMDNPPLKIGVIALTAVIMLALTIMYFKTDKRRSFMRTSFVFIVAGGVGNLIDRIYYQVWNISTNGTTEGVRDMVNLDRFGFNVCNFADFFITAGAVMLILSFLFLDRDAFHPVGKYKKLQEEYEREQELKKQENKAEKNG